MDRLKNFGFLLKDLSRRYVMRFEQRASEMSLTLTQCKALAKLEENEGISQVRLAELTDVEPMTMVRILDRMESDGLLERRPDPVDRRARRLYLTDKARPLVADIWHLAELTRAEMFSGITEGDREVFMNVLERLHANASALTGQPVAPNRSAQTPATAAEAGAALSVPAMTQRRGRAASRTEPTSN